MEKIYIDTLIYITRHSEFSPEMAVRYRTLMELISAEGMRDNLQRVLESCRGKESMKTYIKKELEIWAKQSFGEDEALVDMIHKY